MGQNALPLIILPLFFTSSSSTQFKTGANKYSLGSNQATKGNCILQFKQNLSSKECPLKAQQFKKKNAKNHSRICSHNRKQNRAIKWTIANIEKGLQTQSSPLCSQTQWKKKLTIQPIQCSTLGENLNAKLQVRFFLMRFLKTEFMQKLTHQTKMKSE